MTASIFLKLPGIEGEALDTGHEAEIEVLSAQWGAAVSIGTTRGAGSVRELSAPSLSDFVVQKGTDKSSPNLFGACVSGQAFDTAIITFRKFGKDQQDYLKITLKSVFISSFSLASSGGENATENVSFNYTAIEMEEKPMKADRTLGAAVSKSFDSETGVVS